MSLSEELQRGVGALWEKMVTHPFVQEMGEGTLPWEKFQVYFQQDHLFLRDWIGLLCLGITKSPDFDAARKLSAFMNSVLSGEEGLFQDAFREMGLSPQKVVDLKPLPTTHAFASYLKNLAYQGTFQEIIAALLCVEWTYLDWSQRLVSAGKRPGNRYYLEWIEIHAGAELDDLVGWMRQVLDTGPVSDRLRLERIFLECLRYEYLFWEMAYRGEEWPR